MERQPRKRYSGEQIIGILKRHLVEGVPVSDVCEQAEIHPTQFYRWQKQLFEVGASVFDRRPGRAESPEVEAARAKVGDAAGASMADGRRVPAAGLAAG